MKRLIQRYLLSLDKSRNQSVAPPERLDEQELKDLITRLQDALRRREESKHAADEIKRRTKVSDDSSLFRPRLHGSGQIFARTKTCTVPPCVYMGPAELDGFLNG